MRDEFYRNLCASELEYDATIDWIAKHNSAAIDSGNPEAWAVAIVHACINHVIYGDDSTMHCSMGMCLVVRYSTRPASENFRKVRLAVCLLHLAKV